MISIKFHMRIKKIMKILEFQIENNENHENPRIQLENHENHENLRISIRYTKLLKNQ